MGRGGNILGHPLTTVQPSPVARVLRRLNGGDWRAALDLVGSHRRRAAATLAKQFLDQLAVEVPEAEDALRRLFSRERREHQALGWATLHHLQLDDPRTDAPLHRLEQPYLAFAEVLEESLGAATGGVVVGTDTKDLVHGLIAAWRRDVEAAQQTLSALAARKALRRWILQELGASLADESVCRRAAEDLELMLSKLSLLHRHCPCSAVNRRGSERIVHLRNVGSLKTLCGRSIRSMEPETLSQIREERQEPAYRRSRLCQACGKAKDAEQLVARREREAGAVSRGEEQIKPAVNYQAERVLEEAFPKEPNEMAEGEATSFARVSYNLRQAMIREISWQVAHSADCEADVRAAFEGTSKEKELRLIVGAPADADISTWTLEGVFAEMLRLGLDRPRFERRSLLSRG